MKKEVVYSLRKEVPYEIAESLAKHIDKRDWYAEMIESYTKDWVKEQKEIIRLNEFINKLSKR